VSVAKNVAMVMEPNDALVGSAPVQRGVDQLRRSLMARGFAVLMCTHLSEAGSGDLCIVIAGAGSPLVRELGVVMPEVPESLAIAPGRLSGREVLLASGGGAAGLVQALTEISDAVARAQNPAATLRPAGPRDPVLPFGTVPLPVVPAKAGAK